MIDPYYAGKIVVRRYYRNYKDRDELYSVANCAVAEALKKYQDNRNCSLLSYVNIQVNFAIKNYLNNTRRYYQRAANSVKLYPTKHYDRYDFIESDYFRNLVSHLKPWLDNKKRQILDLSLDGYTKEEIREKLNLSKPCLSAHLGQIRKLVERKNRTNLLKNMYI